MKNTSITIILAIAVGVLFAISALAASPKKNLQDVDTLMKKAGQAYADKEYAKTIKLYRQAADLGNAWGQNNLAWIYATFIDPQYRNGKLAVSYALKATDREPQNSAFFRTLAAAYARNGEFDNAIKAQQKAIELLPEDTIFSKEAKEQLRIDNQEKLTLYQKHQAYVDKK